MRTLNERLVLRFLGFILLFLNSLLDVYILIAFLREEIVLDNVIVGGGVSGGLWLLMGVMFYLGKSTGKNLEDINIKDAVLVVVGSWGMLVFIGAVPYYLYGLSIADVVFESASGFTTTGSTIVTDIEILPASLLLWRSATQWIGGMGIVLFFVSVVPAIGTAGKSLFSYEVPGPVKESMTPQIRDTARILWLIYLGFTMTLFLILRLQGLSWFDALNHAFTTLATAGFSTKNDSIMGFSVASQWTISLFMLIGGTNFGLYRLLFTRQRKNILKDVEVRWYLSFIFLLSAFMIIWNLIFYYDGNLEQIFRENIFTVIAMVTTTGYANADYELFPIPLQALLLLTLFTGGSAGSTTGGIKFYRLVLVYRSISEQIKQTITPNLVSHVKVGGHLLKQEVIFSTFVFLFIYLSVILMGSIVFLAMGIDFTSALTASASFVGNVGPAFSTVGPTENYAHFPDAAKIIGAFLMILGRLEFFAILTVFHRSFWREN